MKQEISTLEFMQKVLKCYETTFSLQKTAKKMKISYAKVRKILITLGKYSTEFSIKVSNLRKKGKSTSEIAIELKTSTNRVSAFSPYEKNIYNNDIPTTNAKKSNSYRKRIKVAKQNFVKKTLSAYEKKKFRNKKGKYYEK